MCGIRGLLRVGHAVYSWHGGFVKSLEVSTGSVERSLWLSGAGRGQRQYSVTSRLAEVMTGDRNRHQICKRKCLWPADYVSWHILKLYLI